MLKPYLCELSVKLARNWSIKQLESRNFRPGKAGVNDGVSPSYTLGKAHFSRSRRGVECRIRTVEAISCTGSGLLAPSSQVGANHVRFTSRNGKNRTLRNGNGSERSKFATFQTPVLTPDVSPVRLICSQPKGDRCSSRLSSTGTPCALRSSIAPA